MDGEVRWGEKAEGMEEGQVLWASCSLGTCAQCGGLAV